MSHRIRFTRAAQDDLLGLYEIQLERDLVTAERALQAITKGLDFLRDFSFACRKAADDQPFLRELVISFGAAGYVALFEIDGEKMVTILAVRHQMEDDYH